MINPGGSLIFQQDDSSINISRDLKNGSYVILVTKGNDRAHMVAISGTFTLLDHKFQLVQ